MTPLTLKAALVATFISALVVFLTRAFPFIVFSYRDPPRIISFIEKYIPPMIMAVLVVAVCGIGYYKAQTALTASIAGEVDAALNTEAQTIDG